MGSLPVCFAASYSVASTPHQQILILLSAILLKRTLWPASSAPDYHNFSPFRNGWGRSYLFIFHCFHLQKSILSNVVRWQVARSKKTFQPKRILKTPHICSKSKKARKKGQVGNSVSNNSCRTGVFWCLCFAERKKKLSIITTLGIVWGTKFERKKWVIPECAG